MGRHILHGSIEDIADTVYGIMRESDETTAHAASAARAQILQTDGRQEMHETLVHIAEQHGIELPYEEKGHR